MTACQVSDYAGAATLLGSSPTAEWLIADRGYDAESFGDATNDKGIRACILCRNARGMSVRWERRRCRRHNPIKIKFGRLKYWRSIANRSDRCARTFRSAVVPASPSFS